MTQCRNTFFGTRAAMAVLVAGAAIFTSLPASAENCNTQGPWRSVKNDYKTELRVFIRDKSTSGSKGDWYGTTKGTSGNKFVRSDYLLISQGRYTSKESKKEESQTLSFTLKQLNTAATIDCTVNVSIRAHNKDNEIRYESYSCDTSKSRNVAVSCKADWSDNWRRMDVRFTMVDPVKLNSTPR